ncbi:MAG: phosphoglycerate dehydrogenase [Cyclobacteriaceae bacterium]|nr:phosphoglycerate dehydrogenase [Cyclobacteriaceae bacterium]
MSIKKCLIIDAMHESLFPMLSGIGWEYDYKPHITDDEIKKIHQHYQGLIVRSKTIINQELLGETPSVKFIGRAGAGLDNLDLEYLQDKGIYVLHAAEGNRDAVGEYTVGSVLALMRNLPKADRQVKGLIWDREGNRGEELMGKTVGIIGYGNMGQAFAKRLSGFGCKVLAYDKYKVGFASEGIREVQMNEIYDECDIVSLHIPLTHETRGLVTEQYFNQFRKRILLINTARGEIVVLADVLKALDSGLLRGAVLDVLENEKLDKLTVGQQQTFHALSKKSNVILTPHIAGWTFESHIKINVALINGIKSLSLR